MRVREGPEEVVENINFNQGKKAKKIPKFFKKTIAFEKRILYTTKACLRR